MIQFANQDEIENHRRQQRARIYDSYNQAKGREATLITKAMLDEQHPLDQWERYSLQSLHQFRIDLQKAEDIEDKDSAFKEAVGDLIPYLLQDQGKTVPIFVRKKEPSELEKGGEGSRGGKVIGHTKSGKPVYAKIAHELSKVKPKDGAYSKDQIQAAAKKSGFDISDSEHKHVLSMFREI